MRRRKMESDKKDIGSDEKKVELTSKS